MAIRSRLLEGQPAPDFIMQDVQGQKVALAGNPGSYILLNFLRYAGCPWCNLAVHALAMEQEKLAAKNCQVISFIQSTKEGIVSYIFDRHPMQPTFPIIADPDGIVYNQYGVGPSFKSVLWMANHQTSWKKSVNEEGFKQGALDGSFFLIPGTFLISPGERTIVRALYGLDISDHNSFNEIYDTLGSNPLL